MDAPDGLKPSAIAVDEILPPRLEDAGLEDCALSLESIHEAFLKAAAAAISRDDSPSTSDDESDDTDDRVDITSPDASDASSAATRREGEANSEKVKRDDPEEIKEACMEELPKLEIR